MAGLLEKLSAIFDNAWEDLIYDPASQLTTLIEIDNIDARLLLQVLPLLGFTSDISLPASATELRRIGINAVPFWNKKPTEEAMITLAIRMVTGNRFRSANWFDFRMQIDQTVITEELENFDPHCVSFPSNKWTGTQCTIDVGGAFTLNDAESAFVSGSSWGWLSLVDAIWPANDGIYPVRFTTSGTRSGEIVDTFPVVHGGNIQWTLTGWASEFLTETRIVDQAVGTLAYREEVVAFTVGQKLYGDDSGATGYITSDDGSTLGLERIRGRFSANETIRDAAGGEATTSAKLAGVLNRELLRILIDLARPWGERIDIVYITFLDQFLQPSDLDQWTINAGTVTVPSPGGYAQLEESARITDADPYTGDLGDAVIAFKFEVDDPDAIAEFAFWQTDDANHYFVRVDYSTKTVSLWKKVASVDTQIGGTVSLPVLKEGVQEVVRVDVLQESTDTRIRVHISGDTRFDESDSPSAFTSGRVGAYASAKTLYLKTAEVCELPVDIERVGPNP
jgi:hypothetical protein